MGKCETSNVSIGIKIRLSDLVEQLNLTTYPIIRQLLCGGYVEDENEYFNEVYKKIVGDVDDSKLPFETEQNDAVQNDAVERIKQMLALAFEQNGSLFKCKYGGGSRADISQGRLCDKHLLFPILQILETERWGYLRTGTNCNSRSLDFESVETTEMYREIVSIIKGTVKVMIIRQCNYG